MFLSTFVLHKMVKIITKLLIINNLFFKGFPPSGCFESNNSLPCLDVNCQDCYRSREMCICLRCKPGYQGYRCKGILSSVTRATSSILLTVFIRRCVSFVNDLVCNIFLEGETVFIKHRNSLKGIKWGNKN